MTITSITYRIREHNRDTNQSVNQLKEYFRAALLWPKMIKAMHTGLEGDTSGMYIITNFAEDYSDFFYLAFHQYNNKIYNNDPDHRRVIEFYERDGFFYGFGLLFQQFHIIVRLIIINYAGNFTDMTSYILKTQLDLAALVSKGYAKLFSLRPTQKLEDLSSELAICTRNDDGNTYTLKIGNAIIALLLVILITGVIIGWKKRSSVNRTYKLLSMMFTQEHLEEEEIHERRRASTTISDEDIPLLYIPNIAEKLKKELPSDININKLYLDLEYEFNINGLKYVGVRESNEQGSSKTPFASSWLALRVGYSVAKGLIEKVNKIVSEFLKTT
uniref:Uncharacterized protein n=1 Tax=Acrobeloides nanus TaxID=290746 RepID=A0A914ED97_9BILA